MDLIVFIAIGAAACVLVLSLMVLVRFVREYDGFVDRSRLLAWRSRPRQLRVKNDAQDQADDPTTATNGRSTTNDDRQASVPRASERVAAYVASAVPAQLSSEAIPPERSIPLNEPEHPHIERAPDGENQLPSSDFGRLGEQVTAVLTTAERAAFEIREAAERDAKQIRQDVESGVADARAAAEALRTEAEAYREETRTAADSYAEETRRAAEEESEAVMAEAARKAQEIETQALRRRDALRQTTIELEERFAEMLTTFRTMTGEVEGLFPAEAETVDDPAEDADVVVDDTLEDALKPERTV